MFRRLIISALFLLLAGLSPAAAAFFFNPTGELIDRPERFDLGVGARIYFGTSGADVFTFSDNQHDKVVVGLGGNDTFNAAASPREFQVRYYDFLRQPEFGMLAGSRTFAPWTGGSDTAHIGGGMHSKLGYGPDITILHGGNYRTPARVWIQPDDRVYMASDRRPIVTEFRVGTIRKVGSVYEVALLEVTVRGATAANSITTGQLLTFTFADQGAYIDSAGRNVYRAPPVLRFARASGPTTAEVQAFVNGWSVLQISGGR